MQPRPASPNGGTPTFPKLYKSCVDGAYGFGLPTILGVIITGIILGMPMVEFSAKYSAQYYQADAQLSAIKAKSTYIQIKEDSTAFQGPSMLSKSPFISAAGTATYAPLSLCCKRRFTASL